MSLTEIESMTTLFPAPNNRINHEKKSEPFKADRAECRKRDPWTDLKVCSGALSPRSLQFGWGNLCWTPERKLCTHMTEDCALADLPSLVRPVLKWEQLAALWLTVRGSCNRRLPFVPLTRGRCSRHRHIQWTRPSHLLFSFSCFFFFFPQNWDYQF